MFPSSYVVVVGLLVSEGVSWQSVGESVLAAYQGHGLGFTDLAVHTSDYYEPEMGPHLRRLWMGVRIPRPLYPVSGLKQRAIWLEGQWGVNGRRRVNIDPGVLTPYQLLLLSTKNYAHRVPITDGIYGEVALIRQKKQWHPLPWTYPDYQSDRLYTWLDQWRGDLQTKRGMG